MRHPALSALLAALLAMPRLAEAQDAPLASAESSGDAAALFRQLDANRDGALSAQELAAPAAQRGNWIAVDRDGDGRITQSEFGVVAGFAPSAATGGSADKDPQKPKAAGRP